MTKRKKKDKAEDTVKGCKNATWCKKEACARYVMLHCSCAQKSCFYSKN
jgi:hypothetical protein